MRLTVDVTVRLAFRVDPNTLDTEGPEIQRHLDTVFSVLHRRMNAPFPYRRFVRLPSDRALNALRREVAAMVSAARARLDAEPGPAPDLRHYITGLPKSVP